MPGSAEWTFDYDPYGQPTTATTAVKNAQAIPLRYAGQRVDTTGLYDMRAREYSPGLGAFTAEDPLAGPQAYG